MLHFILITIHSIIDLIENIMMTNMIIMYFMLKWLYTKLNWDIMLIMYFSYIKLFILQSQWK